MAVRINVPARVKPLLQGIGRIAADRGMRAYAVGGCVRDWLLAITKTTDVDVAVEGSALDVARATALVRDASLEVHAQFGTATLRMRTPRAAILRVDFATCRKETYAKPAAYPTVTPGTLRDDLFRRDFTINAIALEISGKRFGTLTDPFGGQRDLRAKRLRMLHERSFLDDPSRILRGIRFAQRFGLRWELSTARALRQAVAAGALGWLNPGRLRKELARMAEEPNPRACVNALVTLLGEAR